MNWRLLSKKTKSPSATTEVICLPFKEWKKKKGFSFRFWLILVKTCRIWSKISIQPQMVCLRKVLLLTSLLSYNWLSIKPVYSLQQCMAKQFALSTRSFDKFQEKEAFSGILPKGISQNIIQRVFLKLQETLKWISIIYIFSGAPKLFFSFISSLLIVWPMERKQESFWVYYPLFRLILFTFYIS